MSCSVLGNIMNKKMKRYVHCKREVDAQQNGFVCQEHHITSKPLDDLEKWQNGHQYAALRTEFVRL